MLGDSLAKRWSTWTGFVLIITPGLQCLYHMLNYVGGSIKIGLPLAQIKRIVFEGQFVYFCENRGTERIYTMGSSGHTFYSIICYKGQPVVAPIRFIIYISCTGEQPSSAIKMH